MNDINDETRHDLVWATNIKRDWKIYEMRSMCNNFKKKNNNECEVVVLDVTSGKTSRVAQINAQTQVRKKRREGKYKECRHNHAQQW